ncbi:MAG: PLP-dependent aminotransferase family protein [Lachnospiraceae bacterium]|nr:PLP-dependent aminotransferase family protein [Lachnospiraceae bacterium]
MNELTIRLETKSQTPLYEQIYTYIKNDIQSGKIKCGDKLPSTRALAKHLEVSRSTVELAYEQLLAEGYVEAQAYRGFFVAKIDDLYQWKQVKEAVPIKEEKKETEYIYDFTPNGIDLNSFPYRTWRKLAKDVLADDKTELFKTGNSQGEYELRNTLCQYLYQSRGVNCEPEQIIVGAGNDYLLMLLQMILGTDCRIAFENPTYRQAYRLFQQLSYETVTVEMDTKGMRVDELRKAQADIAYVMPSHQYPLGIVMPIQRRMELLRWASEKEGRYIIEDDYDSEFRYKGKPIPALQGYDRNDKVIYIGTFSKSIAPAIRVSYLVLPEPLLEIYKEKGRFLNSTVSRVDQQIIQRFIGKGYYERHLNKMRGLYKSRHDVMIGSLKPLLKKCKISGENAGVHLLLTFPVEISESELIERAKEMRIKVYGLSAYDVCVEKKLNPTILLGYANMTEEEIEKGVRQLIAVWDI